MCTRGVANMCTRGVANIHGMCMGQWGKMTKYLNSPTYHLSKWSPSPILGSGGNMLEVRVADMCLGMSDGFSNHSPVLTITWSRGSVAIAMKSWKHTNQSPSMMLGRATSSIPLVPCHSRPIPQSLNRAHHTHIRDTHACTHAHTCTHTHMHSHTHTHKYTHTQHTYMHTNTHMHTHTRTHMHTHSHTHMHSLTHTHAHSLTHTHTCTLRITFPLIILPTWNGSELINTQNEPHLCTTVRPLLWQPHPPQGSWNT